jgi:hypothetical protein
VTSCELGPPSKPAPGPSPPPRVHGLPVIFVSAKPQPQSPSLSVLLGRVRNPGKQWRFVGICGDFWDSLWAMARSAPVSPRLLGLSMCLGSPRILFRPSLCLSSSLSISLWITRKGNSWIKYFGGEIFLMTGRVFFLHVKLILDYRFVL